MLQNIRTSCYIMPFYIGSLSLLQIWCKLGKPRAGPIFNTRTKDKYLYKSKIREKRLNQCNNITNELNEALLKKKKRFLENME